ncbi:hypothetical protein H0H92_002456 [Tricholoma furcatifolium]|nr:hypothetical protein H0H92_002456 [Tricholoma furcatifolium]
MDYRTDQNGVWQGLPGGGGITGWQDGSGVGSGLQRSGMRGSCLRRKPASAEDSGTASGSGYGNTKLSELIPRFIRLSALVAVEMALEAKDASQSQDASPGVTRDGVDQFSVSDQEWAQMQQRHSQGGFPSLPLPASPTMARVAVQSQGTTYDSALPPTREWYLLLCGLLTRAALEGYLTAGWRGAQAVECLLTVGLGMPESVPPGGQEEELDEFEEFDPDGLPTLREAMRLLFPMSHSPHRKSRAEEEYGIEMRERLRRFYDIPASTPDLSTHMEDLAWQYPAEPVERAAVRFCEAVARWRGKPELESTPIPGTTSSLPMNSLVHSNPPTPTLSHPHAQSQSRPSSHIARRHRRKPSIDTYFSQPSSSFQDTSWNPNKRRRTSDATRPGPSKRPNFG